MSKCKDCGGDHDHDAVTAAFAFEQILGIVAGDPEKLNPDVLIHVVGLMGAMLIRYSDYTPEDVFGEVARILENEPALAKLHEQMVKRGLAVQPAH